MPILAGPVAPNLALEAAVASGSTTTPVVPKVASIHDTNAELVEVAVPYPVPRSAPMLLTTHNTPVVPNQHAHHHCASAMEASSTGHQVDSLTAAINSIGAEDPGPILVDNTWHIPAMTPSALASSLCKSSASLDTASQIAGLEDEDAVGYLRSLQAKLLAMGFQDDELDSLQVDELEAMLCDPEANMDEDKNEDGYEDEGEEGENELDMMDIE